VLWLVAVGGNLFLRLYSGFSAEELGAFGDWFGAINALLSGLSVAGVAAALLIQVNEQRGQRDADLREHQHRTDLLTQQVTIAKAEAFVSFKNIIMQSNSMSLRSPELLKTAMSLMYPEQAEGSKAPANPQTRWIAFNMLNTAELAWAFDKLGLDHGVAFDQARHHHMERLLQSREVMEALRVGGYCKEFVDHCRKLYPAFDGYMQNRESTDRE
jgi:hypothetical protein